MRNESRNILLVLDNAPCHPIVEGLSNIRLEFLPTKTISLIQLLDKGLIKNVKDFYRKKITKN